MKKILLAVVAAFALFAFANSPVSAAPITAEKSVSTVDSHVSKVQWFGFRCVKWRHRCHRRFGYGHRYRRCMRRHDCRPHRW
ncbi:MAG: glycosyl hydrolase family 5 [Alphaproteobacteria bacterium]